MVGALDDLVEGTGAHKHGPGPRADLGARGQSGSWKDTALHFDVLFMDQAGADPSDSKKGRYSWPAAACLSVGYPRSKCPRANG